MPVLVIMTCLITIHSGGKIFRLKAAEGSEAKSLSSKKDEWCIQESFSLARGSPDDDEVWIFTLGRGGCFNQAESLWNVG